VGTLQLPTQTREARAARSWCSLLFREPASAPLLDYLNSHASISVAPPSHAVGSKDAGGK
jgi:hypothetical protein